MAQLPFPKHHSEGSDGASVTSIEPPWEQISHRDPPVLSLKLCLSNGMRRYFTCGDIREVEYRDAGFVKLKILGFEKYEIVIEGRHLDELPDLLANAKLRSISELGHDSFDRPESCPSIDQITIHQMTGTASYPIAPSA